MKRSACALCLILPFITLGQTAPPSPTRPAESPPDSQLQWAIEHPGIFQLTETTTSRADALAYELVITSARGITGKIESVYVLPGSIRVFRPATDLDEFTRKGGWYWRINGVEGKSQLSKPGALILVLRDLDGTVHWYSLELDFRC